MTENLNRWLLIAGAGCAAIAALAGLFGPHDASVWRLPQVLQQRAETALLTQGFPGIEAKADGQHLRLRGIVEDERDIEAARRVALSSSGAGGAWAGGVTSVDASAVETGAMVSPYEWSARRDGQRLVLSGSVPSEGARAELRAAATRAFGNVDVVNQMQVAGGAPSPAFTRVAASALRVLAGLRAGEARIVDQQVAIIGDGEQPAVNNVHAAFANPPAPFRARLVVSVNGLDVDHPELQGLDLTSGDAGTCERAFGRLMERNVINFASGSAAIEPSSRDVLNALASVALRCDRFSIEVAGHTDNQGAREMNMDLSRRRAEAVAQYLSSQGVARSRLTARGYGPDRPRRSNDTEAGQAANRRIEFNVSS